MVNLLIAVGITGLAVSYAVEFFGLLTFDYWGSNFGHKFLTLPLSTLGLYLFGYWNKESYVAVPAATFVSAVILKWLNTPVIVDARRKLPRL